MTEQYSNTSNNNVTSINPVTNSNLFDNIITNNANLDNKQNTIINNHDSTPSKDDSNIVKENSVRLDIQINMDSGMNHPNSLKIDHNTNDAVNNSSHKLENNLFEELKENEKKILNQEYYDEFNRPKYDDIIQYENSIRQEIENNSPLVSDQLNIEHLLLEFKETIFEKAILDVMKNYKFIRTIRRDGNCFYRSYLFRLFEQMALKKDSKLYNDVLKVTENCKDFFERNFYQWLIVEDFHNAFINEWKLCYTLDPNNLKEYLSIFINIRKMLFQNKERCNYLIYFIRMFTAAYIKENRFLYEGFIDEDLDSFCQREIESVDVECDHIQMIAITNAFDYGVIVQSIQDKKLETLKFPEESKNSYYVHVLFRPGHYDILYQS